MPWWSNLSQEAGQEIQSSLALRWDGAPASLQFSAVGLPIQPRLQARLKVENLALAPWWAWMPADLALRPQQGWLEAELALVAQRASSHGPWDLALSGTTAVRDLGLWSAAGSPLASWKRLDVALEDVRPLQKQLHLGAVRLQGAEVHVRRQGDGALEWASLGVPAGKGSGSPASAGATGPPSEWQIRTREVAVQGLHLNWTDQTMRPSLQATVSPVDVRIAALSWPLREPTAFELAARVLPPAVAGRRGAAAWDLALQGSASAQAAQVNWRIGPADLAPWQPYLALLLRPAIQGTLQASGSGQWASGDKPRLQTLVRSLQVDDFQVRMAPPSGSPASASSEAPIAFKSLLLQGLQADWMTRRLALEQVTWREPAVQLKRARDGSVG